MAEKFIINALAVIFLSYGSFAPADWNWPGEFPGVESN
jgi:hypothetical protein